MRPGLRTTTGLLLVCAAAWTSAGETGAGAPRSLARRRAGIEEAEQRLDALIEKATADPRLARVDAYLALARPEEFASTKRPRVAELVDMLADDDAPLQLKERVRDALKSITHRSLDPDLQLSDTRNKRVAFCRDKLVPLLGRPGDKALPTRALAAEILESYWHFTDSAIQRYNPQDDSTWKKAAEAYRKGLQSR